LLRSNSRFLHVIIAYRPVVSDLDLTHPQYLVMFAHWESPRSVKVSPSCSDRRHFRSCSRVEASGYVTRVHGDERSLAAGLTLQRVSLCSNRATRER
jgi:hypothetical protein